jgi:RNA polymerase sigma factor (sigma-70 family)
MLLESLRINLVSISLRGSLVATQRADLGARYRKLADRLQEIVRADVRAPDAVIEDACQVAWTRLMRDPERVRDDRTLAWLARTAVREACRQIRRDSRHLSLDSELASCASPSSRGAQPQEWLEQRERLALVGRLPLRQQRMLWLHALGLHYDEIAAHDSCSARTVERQLLRAKRAVRMADAQ